MIKHIVAFRFKHGISESKVKSILEEQGEFPKRFPKMRNWTMGKNISKRDDTFTYAFVVEFESEKDLTDYLNSEEHESWVRDKWRPFIEKRAIVSYEFTGKL